MEALVWRRRRESSPAARKGRAAARGLDARRCFQNASCQRWTLHLRCQAYQNHLDIDHGIYREPTPTAYATSAMPPKASHKRTWLMSLKCHYRKSLAIKLTRPSAFGLFQIERIQTSKQFAPPGIKSMILK
jgi:hypothetical protein